MKLICTFAIAASVIGCQAKQKPMPKLEAEDVIRSSVVEIDNLKVSIKPAYYECTSIEGIGFELTLENTSDKLFVLVDAGFTGNWRVAFKPIGGTDKDVIFHANFGDYKCARSLTGIILKPGEKNMDMYTLYRNNSFRKDNTKLNNLPDGIYEVSINIRCVKLQNYPVRIDDKFYKSSELEYPCWVGTIKTAPVHIKITGN